MLVWFQYNLAWIFSFGDPLLKWFKPFEFVEHHVHQHQKRGKMTKLSKFLTNFKIIWQKCFFKVTLFNPFPHKDAFWRLCSRQLFENMATKEYISQNEQFLFLSPCFQLYSIIEHSFKREFQKRFGYVNKIVCCRVIACGKGSKCVQIIGDIKHGYEG